MNGSRGLVIAIAASFIVGCSVGLIGGVVFTHVMGYGRHGWGTRDDGPPSMARRGPRGMHDDRMMPYLTREMHLTDQQQQRMRELIDRARREHEAVRESMEVWLDLELTPAQRTRWKEIEAEMRARRRGPDGRGGPPGAPPDGSPGGPPPAPDHR